MKLKNMTSLVTAVIELAIGILLLVDPTIFTSGLVILSGIVLCLVGIWSVISYFRMDAVTAARGSSLAIGLGAIALGVALLINTRVLMDMTTVLTLLLGVVILASSLVKVQQMVNMLRLKIQRWYLCAITAGVTMAIGIMILWNPFATTDILWIFLGVMLIVDALLDLVSVVFGQKDKQAPQAESKDVVEEAPAIIEEN